MRPQLTLFLSLLLLVMSHGFSLLPLAASKARQREESSTLAGAENGRVMTEWPTEWDPWASHTHEPSVQTSPAWRRLPTQETEQGLKESPSQDPQQHNGPIVATLQLDMNLKGSARVPVRQSAFAQMVNMLLSQNGPLQMNLTANQDG